MAVVNQTVQIGVGQRGIAERAVPVPDLELARDDGASLVVPVIEDVADFKLCSHDYLSFIDRAGGRFVTVLPRSRREDKLFRKWLQTDTPSWELIWDRSSVRHPEGPRDIWFVYRDPLGSAEGFTIVWVWSTLLTLRQQARRHRNIATAIEALTALRRRILGPRSRVRGGSRIDLGRLATHDRYLPTLPEVLKAVNACFDRWRRPNDVLRRLCCIT